LKASLARADGMESELNPQSIVQTLHRLAGAASVDITSFKPRNSSVSPHHISSSFDVGLVGAYHDVGRFFAGVAAVSPMTSVSELQIRAENGPKGSSGVTVSCVLTAYTFPYEPAGGRP
jgi:Tfp pilus assembly protein PilO